MKPAATIRRFLLCALLLPGGNIHAQAPQPDPAQVLEKLQQSTGAAPWMQKPGYRLAGEFIHKALGEETPYQAVYLRLPDQWVAGFQPADPTRRMKCGYGSQSWIWTPEATAVVNPAQLPLCARYEYPLLHQELTRILQQGPRESLFKIGRDTEGIYVRGVMRDGHEATFVLNPVDGLPRKVSITLGPQAAAPAWSFVVLEPGGSAKLIHFPGTAAERFEIWLSEPVETDNYRYQRRSDYLLPGGVAGTFFMESCGPADASDPLLEYPANAPWQKELAGPGKTAGERPSFYLPPGRAAYFRSRLAVEPWLSWSRYNTLAAWWAAAAFWLPRIIPSPTSPTLIGVVQLVLLIAIVVIILRHRARRGRPVSALLLTGLLTGWGLVFASGIATIQVSRAPTRGLLALHSAIRFAATGNSMYARITGLYLRTLPGAAPARSMTDLGHASESYSLAYDLIRSVLAPARRREIEGSLAEYAKLLYGALQGWRANTGTAHTMAAGLGAAGLAVADPGFINAAEAALKKGLDEQIREGVHREGPGAAAEAMDSAINLARELKLVGREDLTNRAAFREYVRTTLNLTSPLGTLPLFGSLSLDQSRNAVPFWLKAAGTMPPETGRQCVAAYNAYWSFGRYSTGGTAGLFVHWAQPFLSFFFNPHVLFHYEKALLPSNLPGESAIAGSGQFAVLRSGYGPDDLFIALNMLRSPAWAMNRSTLTFDFTARGSLLLHGPGSADPSPWEKKEELRTQDFNSITFAGEDQSSAESTGVAAALINQPVFDFVRVFADRVYEQGQVQRDLVLARGNKEQPAYAVIIDEVHATDPEVSVQAYFHGGKELSRGIDQSAKWTVRAFRPPAFRTEQAALDFQAIGFDGRTQTATGRMRYESSFLNHEFQTLILEWTGSQRFFTVMLPHRAKDPAAVVEQTSDEASARVGSSDWIGLGDLDSPRPLGPFQYSAEFCLARDNGKGFPALLLISGIGFSHGSNSFACDKPVSLSLDGLEGTLMNSRPDTRIDVASPSIPAGQVFYLDGNPLTANAKGQLSIFLSEPGQHRLTQTKK
jgi:hypothetical protein